MIPLHHERHFTFRFGEPRIVPRFHLEGVAIGVRVSIHRFDAINERRLDLIATALVSEGGWVELAEPLHVSVAEGFIVEPE
jgi:hypothetical protein